MRFSLFILIGGLAVTSTLIFHGQEQGEQQIAEDKPGKIVVPTDGPDGVARRDFMRAKLINSQNIFEGLTTANFDLVQDGVKALKSVAAGEKWVQIDDARYQKMTDEFRTTVNRLAVAAEGKNIDAMALRYYQMSTSCIDCHKHIRKAGYEF